MEGDHFWSCDTATEKWKQGWPTSAQLWYRDGPGLDGLGWSRAVSANRCFACSSSQPPAWEILPLLPKKERKTRPKASFGSVLAGNHWIKDQRAHNKHPNKHLQICQSLPLAYCSMLCLMFRQWPAPWAGPDPKRLVVPTSGDFMLISVDSSN